MTLHYLRLVYFFDHFVLHGVADALPTKGDQLEVLVEHSIPQEVCQHIALDAAVFHLPDLDVATTEFECDQDLGVQYSLSAPFALLPSTTT